MIDVAEETQPLRDERRVVCPVVYDRAHTPVNTTQVNYRTLRAPRRHRSGHESGHGHTLAR